MTTLMDHPTVKHVQARPSATADVPTTVDADWLRQLCRAAGADDVGFVEVERAEAGRSACQYFGCFSPHANID
ncbi:MAG: hypothetical protein R3C14_49500 [Caldilineaceae bacterium]